METTARKIPRRSFFAFLLAGGAGTITFRGLLKTFTGRFRDRDSPKNISVNINPLAVPRTKTDASSHE
jgi:hypothetical protein